MKKLIIFSAIKQEVNLDATIVSGFIGSGNICML